MRSTILYLHFFEYIASQDALLCVGSCRVVSTPFCFYVCISSCGFGNLFVRESTSEMLEYVHIVSELLTMGFICSGATLPHIRIL